MSFEFSAKGGPASGGNFYPNYFSMAVPRARKTKGATGRRRSHLHLTALNFSKCKNCGNVVMPHVICENCGQYRGRQVLVTTVAVPKKEAKQ